MSKSTPAKKLTQEQLKKLLDYDPNTGLFTWLVNRSVVHKGDIAGCIAKDGYCQIRINMKTLKTHRLAWLFVYGYFPENGIDHIDRNRQNNKISNLREVSMTCNNRNKANSRINQSGVKGISWHSATGKWCAGIKINRKSKNLGYFEEFEDAVIARWEAEKKYDFINCCADSPAYLYLKEMCLI